MDERLYLRLAEDLVHGPEADIPAGTLRAFAPCTALLPYVSHILSYRENVPEGREIFERILPDGSVRIVFNLGNPPLVDGHRGYAVQAIGASIDPVVLRLRGRIEGLSITLRPGAAAALLGVPAGTIGGMAVPLDELWRGAGADFLERLAEQREETARVAVLEAGLLQRLQSTADTHSCVAVRAAQLIANADVPHTLREVAAAIGVGERRLQQIFYDHVGVTPRAWVRLMRIHRCLRALRRHSKPSWTDVALDSGFYDQPHLANEFRSLTGLSPTEFLGRSISGSSKTPDR